MDIFLYWIINFFDDRVFIKLFCNFFRINFLYLLLSRYLKLRFHKWKTFKWDTKLFLEHSIVLRWWMRWALIFVTGTFHIANSILNLLFSNFWSYTTLFKLIFHILLNFMVQSTLDLQFSQINLFNLFFRHFYQFIWFFDFHLKVIIYVNSLFCIF
jgi:hypothetical protein